MTGCFKVLCARKSVQKSGLVAQRSPYSRARETPLQYGKYRVLRLLEHGAKIWEKILDRRLKEIVVINDNQFWFAARKSTTDATYVLRNIQQKYCEKKKKLYHIFVDLEKAFDMVPTGGH